MSQNAAPVLLNPVETLEINVDDNILYDFEPLSITNMKTSEFVASKFAPAWKTDTGFYYIFNMKTASVEYSILVNSKLMDLIAQLRTAPDIQPSDIQYLSQFAIGMLETCMCDDIWQINGEIFSQTEFGKKMNEQLNAEEVNISMLQVKASDILGNAQEEKETKDE